MNLQITFFLTASGLFDFDLTFVAEALLFLLLAFIVTFVFLSPVSKQLDERAESINYSLRKASLFLTFEYNLLSTSLDLLTSETTELTRQLKLVKIKTTEAFETEISSFQKENTRILTSLKGELLIQSGFIITAIHRELEYLTASFCKKKFQAN